MYAVDWSYPRPDFDRSARWLGLEGAWEFARGADADDGSVPPDPRFAESIAVPFAWEAAASGVGAAWLERGWYRRRIEVPAGWQGERIVCFFGGVHHRARIYLDGALVGEHAGVGAFECDLTEALAGRASGMLLVGVEAPIDKRAIAHGKQRSIPADDYDSCAFQPSSGIWQPVWLEPRPATFVRSMHLEPKTSLDGFVVRLQVEGAHASGSRCELYVDGGAATPPVVLGPDGRAEVILAIDSPRTWSPEEPHLYRIIARLESADGVDEVACTSGLRSIEVVGDELHLNGRRAYLRGVLDQGYWPRSGLTAPSPAALRRDLDLAREAGYNLVRKHLKLEDPRWLHYADTIGMLVWEEPPSTSRFSDDSLAAFRQGVQQMVARDANHPCIVVWGCFNEEWGLDWRVVDDPVLQDAVDGTVAQLRSLDESRPIVDNSGWSHVGGDLADWHYYEPDLARWAKNVEHLVEDETAVIPVPLHPPALELKPLAARPGAMKGRPNLNGEYGVGMTSVERGWHLKWQTQELRRHDRLSGYVYTELYDIEHEFAGVISAERAPKDLGNVALSDVNAETVLVLDVLPEQPGIDLRVSERRFVLGVRCSHHGARRVAGMLRVAWGPHFGPPPVRTADASGAELGGEPFVLSAPVSVTAELPESERAGRLHVWLEREGRVLAATHLDVVQADA